MEKEKIIKKIKEYAPAVSIILVAACVGTTLGNYTPPTYEVQAKENVKQEQSEQTSADVDTAKGSFDLSDGIYKGTGIGYAGEITVAVQIQN